MTRFRYVNQHTNEKMMKIRLDFYIGREDLIEATCIIIDEAHDGIHPIASNEIIKRCRELKQNHGDSMWQAIDEDAYRLYYDEAIKIVKKLFKEIF